MAEREELQSALRELLLQIAPLRQEAAELRTALDRVKRDYEPRLGELNAEAEDLQRLKEALEAQLAGEPGPQVKKPPVERGPDVLPPPEVKTAGPEKAEQLPEPLPVVRDERKERKLDIADHIESLLSYEDWSAVMEDVNAILSDPKRDVGDLLELVPWGDFWTVKTEGETAQEQLVRLAWWRQALEERLAYWRDEVRRLKAEDHYVLWLRMRQLSEPEWLRLLETMAQMQERENEELRRQVACLQQRLDREG